MFPENILGDLLRSLYLTFHTLNLVITKKIDALYINRVDSLESIISGYITSKFLRKPLILVIHHISLERKLSVKESLAFWKSREVSFRGRMQRFFGIIIRRFIHPRADACIAVTENTAKEVRQYINPRALYVTGNGLDLEKFYPDTKVEKINDACYLGRIDRFKGIEVLLSTWRIVVEKHPEAKLILIGGGPYIDNYKDLVEKLSITRNVQFTGWVSDEEVISSLRSSKLFLFCSTWEGRPLAVSEAMACGLCCIISDIPQLKENFYGGVDFADPKDPLSFALKALYYLTNDDKRIKLESKAYQFAQKFDWNSVARKEVAIFRSHLGIKNKSN